MRHSLIPDTYKGDRHLTNWMRKHLCMSSLELVYVHEDSERGHITKKEGSFESNYPMFLQFPNKVVKMEQIQGIMYMENLHA